MDVGGETHLLFRYSPTPTVRWIRLGGVAMPDKNIHASFGQELVIPDADFSDSGRYQCSAVNSATAPPAIREFNINVECKCDTLLHAIIGYLRFEIFLFSISCEAS